MTERKTTWKKGQSGNPSGKPQGARNRATVMVLAMMEDGAKEITQAVINAARGGDLSAARLVLERLAPPMRERPISIDLPDTTTAEGISKAQQAIIEAVGMGELLPGEGSVLAGLIEAKRKALETIELEQRVTTLEEKANAKN